MNVFLRLPFKTTSGPDGAMLSEGSRKDSKTDPCVFALLNSRGSRSTPTFCIGDLQECHDLFVGMPKGSHKHSTNEQVMHGSVLLCAPIRFVAHQPYIPAPESCSVALFLRNRNAFLVALTSSLQFRSSLQPSNTG